jgi:pimeloyl-ACP methyl ester carboxylesterase
VAFDLPGLGLADRPPDFDYSWTGLGRLCTAAVQELGLDRLHLVVHDIGGRSGFELAAALPDRIACLTVLNTLVGSTRSGVRGRWSRSRGAASARRISARCPSRLSGS